jgi:hypothetical protein
MRVDYNCARKGRISVPQGQSRVSVTVREREKKKGGNQIESCSCPPLEMTGEATRPRTSPPRFSVRGTDLASAREGPTCDRIHMRQSAAGPHRHGAPGRAQPVLIRYGDFAQACYDSLDYHRYCGTCHHQSSVPLVCIPRKPQESYRQFLLLH